MKQKKKKSSKSNSAGGGGGFINVDPERIRFQHSRIRPHFSGCGRSVHSTLDAMRDGTLSPYDLPPIQVSEDIDLTKMSRALCTFYKFRANN